MAENEETKPLDPEEVRRAFRALQGTVARVEERLDGMDESVRRAQRLALTAEHRADESRLDAHAAEVKIQTCRLDYESTWRFLQKALEDIVALRGRLRVLEDANGTDPGADPESGVEGDRDRDVGSGGARAHAHVDLPSS